MSVVTATILSEGKPMEPTYELLSLDIHKEVNRIPAAQLVLLDGDAAQQRFALSDSTFFEPGKQVEIKLRYEGKADTTAFTGVIVSQGVESGPQGSLLTVELKDTAVKLTFTRRSQVYRNQSDSKIISTLLSNSGLKKGKIATTALEHAELVRYDCTDWDFMLTRAESCGLLVCVEGGEISLQPIALQGAAKHKFEYGSSELFNFHMEADASDQFAAVQSIAWDIKNQRLTRQIKGKEVTLGQGNLNASKIAKAVGGNTQQLTTSAALAPAELQAWADGTLARSRLALLRGRLATPGFANIRLLDVIEVAGVGKRFNGKTLVTGIRHRVDQQGWQTDVQFGLSTERFVERHNPSVAPASGLLPGVHGLQIGVVDQFEEDPTKEWRVKVILPGIDEKEGKLWARLATPEAGKKRGYFFRPEPGDEVVVGFFNADPRQAVILGALYSSQNAPPDAVAKLTKENKDKGIITKNGIAIRFLDDKKAKLFIETPGANKVVLDDDAEQIQISDKHGNQITLSKDGIQIKSAKDLQIEASGNLTLKSSKNVEIQGQKVDIK